MSMGPGHIMVFGCHACDAEEMAGPVLAKYARAGGKGTIVALTRGERGHPTKPPEVYGPQLEREMKESAAVLGVETMWMGFTSGDVSTNEKVMLAICDLIRKLKPDFVVTHWVGSQHPRHASTHHNVVGGVRYAASPSVERELPPHKVKGVYFGENIADLDGFVPNVYIDITDTYDVWLEAMSKYELYTRTAEKGHTGFLRESPPYQTFYPTMAIVRGHEAGFRYAKAFMKLRQGRDFF